MRRLSMVLLLLGVLLLVHGVLRADVAMPRDKWTHVRMVSEHVKIILSPSKVTVEGTYVLKNEREAVTAVVGYPRGVLEKSLDDFTVTADGERLTVGSQEGEKAGGPPRLREPEKPEPGKPVKAAYQFAGPYPEWKTFDVKFDAKQERKLVVKYHVTPAELKTADNGRLLAYVYTLKTGATWLGKIDKAVIEMDLDGLSLADLVSVTPKQAARVDGSRTPLLWVFKDFKPTQDIEVTFRAPEAQAKK
ncbi:MAG TPA: hypothetical protein VMZ92_01255 [Planctomycetota bacterium]|nr:hypothetical protein [Planctomycetota bacterium]